MLNLNSIMVGTMQPKALAEFYVGVFGKPADMSEGEWSGWMVGSAFFSVGQHSDAKGSAKEPARIMFNLETADVKLEFERIKARGATVIKEPYEAEGHEGMWIATFADPDGNYFQLMSPWKE
ncbi:MAG: VOC family protein [bacterium]|nr:VOC family protein [bacterium]MDZ4284759.1 VOC family protein [Patescibacteria group bacterium]